MRLGGEGLEVLAGELGFGDGEEFLLDLGLGGEVGIAEDGRWGSGLGWKLAGIERQKKQEGKRVACGHESGLIQQVGELAIWRVGELASWQVGELASLYATGTGWVQWAQRLAARGISLRHSGQVFMDDGASGAGFLSLARSVFKGKTMPK